MNENKDSRLVDYGRVVPSQRRPDSEHLSSVPSDLGFTHAPLLPSASSAANVKQLAGKMGKFYAMQDNSARGTAAREPGSLNDDTTIAPSHTATEADSLVFDGSQTLSGFVSRLQVLVGPTSEHTSDIDSRRASFSSQSSHGFEETERATEDSWSESQGFYSSQFAITRRGREAEDDPETKRIMERYRRLQEQRGAQKSAWKRLDRQRTSLQDARQDRSQAYMNLHVAILSILPQHSHLDKLFKKAQVVDLNLQAEEANLDDLIDDYQAVELRVDLEERQFFTNETIKRTAPNNSLRGIEGVRRDLVHPLFQRFENTVMDIRNQKEWKRELRSRKKALELMQPEQYTADDEYFLQHYEDYQQQAQEEAKCSSEMATELEAECRRNKVIPKGSPYEQPGYWQNPHAGDEIQLDRSLSLQDIPKGTPKTLAHPLYPHLLSNPKHLLQNPIPRTAKESLRMAASLPPTLSLKTKFVEEAEKECLIEDLLSTSQNGNKDDYINRWLLQKLRLSPLEVEVLWGTFRFYGAFDIDIDQWQHDVIKLWTRDPSFSTLDHPP